MSIPLKSKFSFTSPAKVNLRLKITGRLPNGYHTLDMIMVPLDLADTLEVEVGGKGIRLSCDVAQFPCDESNTVWKAVSALQKQSGHEFGVAIHVKKKTPVAAGLGGGSSNAAAILKGLNRELGLGLTKDVLHRLAVKIGADVPFFLETGAHQVSGIGDLLTPVVVPPMHFVLMNPGFPVSTADAYRWFDELTSRSMNATQARFVNDLEEVVIPRYPVLAQMKQQLLEAGALGALMSGSGGTVFAWFDSPDTQARGYEFVKKKQDSSGWVCQARSI